MHLYRFSKFPATYTITLWLEYIFSTDFTSDLKWLQIKSESACVGNYTAKRENPHIPRVDDDVTSFQIFLVDIRPFFRPYFATRQKRMKRKKGIIYPCIPKQYLYSLRPRSQEWTVFNNSKLTHLNSSFMAGIGKLKQRRRRRLSTKTALKKWSRSASNFIALFPSRLIRQMLAVVYGVEF